MIREVASESGFISKFVLGPNETETETTHAVVPGVAAKYWTTVWSYQNSDGTVYDGPDEKDVLLINSGDTTLCINWSVEGDVLTMWVDQP